MMTADGILKTAESMASGMDGMFVSLTDAKGDINAQDQRLDKDKFRLVVIGRDVVLRHDPIEWGFSESRPDVLGWRVHDGKTHSFAEFQTPKRIRQAGDKIILMPTFKICEVKQ